MAARLFFAQTVWQMAGLATRVVGGRLWWLAAILSGTVPLLLGWQLGTSVHQFVSALLLFFMLLAAARMGNASRGIGAMALGFASHCALGILLSFSDSVGAAECMPDGRGYWLAQVAWITSGTDPEYDWANWLPAHLHLGVGIAVLCVGSLGLFALVEGFYEVDLMNYYVGQLLANSSEPIGSLLLGWHPWSVMRGFCYVLLVYEIAAWALGRFSQRRLPQAPSGFGGLSARSLRLVGAACFFLADCTVKYFALDFVRSGLAERLVQG